MQDLASMKYAELRKLAKKAGVKANQKQEKLIIELTKYYEKQKISEKKEAKATKTPVSTPKIAPKTPTLSQKPRTTTLSENPKTPLIGKNTPKSTPVVTSQVANKNNLPKSTPVATIQVANNTPKVDNNTPKSTPVATIQVANNTPKSTPVATSQVANNTPKSTPVATIQVANNTPKVDNNTPKVDNNTPKVDNNTPHSGKPVSRWEKKVFSPVKTARASDGKLPASPLVKQVAVKRKQVDTPENSQPTKKGRSTFEKAPTPDLMSPNVAERKKRRSTFEKPPTLKTPEIQSGSTEKRRSGRRSSSSPAVKEMLGAMRSDMNDDEMKNSLLSILDKNVQDKVNTAPPQGSTSIPRFAAFVKNRQTAKPITPGNKNWEKIHKKNFDKFDSIDVYLQKKRKRVEDMSASVKKAKTLLSEVHSVVDKLKSHKTPDANENKFAKPRKSNANRTTPFKPTVLNTTKLNLNFGAKPAPKTLPRKSPKSMISSTVKRPPTDARKSTSSVPQTKSTATPFKFTAVHNSTLNCSVASTKKNTFDIKASLARPITWKTHKGKLKPLTCDTISPVYIKTNSTAKATKTAKDRTVSRNTVANRRANKKHQAQMARRGINV